jgi:imidazolonepropionase-like amidohydrolase
MRVLILLFLFFGQHIIAQETVYPAIAHRGSFWITNATIHVGNGTVIDKGYIKITNDKIESVRTTAPTLSTTDIIIDAGGKHVYPGLILCNSQLGLIEVNAVRATIDHTEIGTINSSIRSIVAYNTDSKVINTLRYNGILLANIVPQGGLISGSSSVVQLDAWNWEDASYKQDVGMHLSMPALVVKPNPYAIFSGTDSKSPAEIVKQNMLKIESLKQFFREAKAYFQQPATEEKNLKLEATKGLFEKKQKLFIHCELVKEMLVALEFADEFGFDIVLTGASESWRIADILAKRKIPVVLAQSHSLPNTEDEDVDQPYKNAAILHKAGVLVAINDEDGQTRGRNLPFNAGTAAAYGLGKETALSAITLHAAKILGIDKTTGSIEAGKDANLLIAKGDILDMRTNQLTHAFILGRNIALESKHTQLYERYKNKYQRQNK